jgi:hypothetical protein
MWQALLGELAMLDMIDGLGGFYAVEFAMRKNCVLRFTF